ncbi:MlrC-like protein [alpha proteobacterium BAL199]|jgi:microcystin degradation protein MlrC|nr:MlrC-like protein [alpha proteobacterium BAL199]
MARIAIGGFQHETNTFAPTKAEYDAFTRGGGWPALVSGEAMFEAVAGINISVAGFIEGARASGHDLVPTTWAAASPSAEVTDDAFDRISGLIVDGLRAALAAGNLDAVYLCLHGAMVTESHEDGEGELLRRVRAVVGPDLPVVASLDLHGNITRACFDAATAMVAYKTYPHIDMADTGRRTAAILDKILVEGVPFKAFRQLEFLIPLSWQCTMAEPSGPIYDRMAALETGGVWTASYLPGFPAADIADCGPTILAYGTTQADADRAADAVATDVTGHEAAFAGKIYDPDEAVAEARRLAAGASKPVVIADTQDNPGAGGNSDTTGMLRALVSSGVDRAAIGLIIDPEAAKAAHAAGVGATITVALGGHSGIPGDSPFKGSFVVEAIHDGNTTGTGPFYKNARMALGPSAALRIGGVRIAVASRKVQMADQALYRFVGIEPTEQAILVNKSSVHFRADFTPIAHAILVAAAPGPMIADPAQLPWSRLRPGVRLSPNGPVWKGRAGAL